MRTLLLQKLSHTLFAGLLCLVANVSYADYVNIDLNGASNLAVFDTANGQRLEGGILGLQTNTYVVDITTTGRYSFDLWDIQGDNQYFERVGAFLNSSSELLTSVSLTTGAETRKASEFLVEAGSYYLTLWGVSDTPAAAYGLELSYIDSTSPVPVPPAVILFGSGLMALFAYGRRQGRAQA